MLDYEILAKIEQALRSPFVSREFVRLLNEFFQDWVITRADALEPIEVSYPSRQHAHFTASALDCDNPPCEPWCEVPPCEPGGCDVPPCDDPCPFPPCEPGPRPCPEPPCEPCPEPPCDEPPPCTWRHLSGDCRCWDGSIAQSPDDCPDCPDGSRPDPDTGKCDEACFRGVDCLTGTSFVLVRQYGHSPGDVVKVGDTCYELEALVGCFGVIDSGTPVDNCEDASCGGVCYKLTSCQNGEVVYTTSDLSSIVDGTGVGLWDGDCWTVTEVDPSECEGDTETVSGMVEQDDCDDEDCPTPCDDCASETQTGTMTLDGIDPADMGCDGSPFGPVSAGDYPDGDLGDATMQSGEGTFTGTGVDCHWTWQVFTTGFGEYGVDLGYDSDNDKWWGFVYSTTPAEENCSWQSDFQEVTGPKCNKDTGKLEGSFTVNGNTFFGLGGTATVSLG